MHYMIMSTQDVQSHQLIELSKSGNQFMIYFAHDRSEGVKARKYFDRLDDAIQVYAKFVDAFARGDYSAEDRASWLA